MSFINIISSPPIAIPSIYIGSNHYLNQIKTPFDYGVDQPHDQSILGRPALSRLKKALLHPSLRRLLGIYIIFRYNVLCFFIWFRNMIGYNRTQILCKFTKQLHIKFHTCTTYFKFCIVIESKISCFTKPVSFIKSFASNI